MKARHSRIVCASLLFWSIASTALAQTNASLPWHLFSLGATDNIIVDRTGRHHVTAHPNATAVSVSELTAPDGSRALHFDGGWLEVTNALPESAGDFEIGEAEHVRLSFYFLSANDDSHLADTRFKDRMYALGFGGELKNLDVDFGDDETTTAEGAPPTACWTYFNGGGTSAIVDSTPGRPNTFYFDGQWHQYVLERRGQQVTVAIDGNQLGQLQLSAALGSAEPGTPNYIGRESVATGKIVSQLVGLYPEASFPWFGYLAGVRLEILPIQPSRP